MRKIKNRVLIIALLQLIFALVVAYGFGWRISNMGWGTPPVQDPLTHYFAMDKIHWGWPDWFLSIFLIVSFIGCAGLFLKKRWGRVLGLITSFMTDALGCGFLAIMLNLNSRYGFSNVFFDIIYPILIFLIPLSLGVFPAIYLTRPHVKDYFKKKILRELDNIVVET